MTSDVDGSMGKLSKLFDALVEEVAMHLPESARRTVSYNWEEHGDKIYYFIIIVIVLYILRLIYLDKKDKLGRKDE